MSSTGELELKAGHPPAVKAGGMRIARTHKNSGSEKSPEMTAEENEEFAEEGQTKGEKHAQSVTVSGATTKEDQAFTPDAVRQYHDKPLPSKEKSHKPQVHNIQQPRQ